MKFVTKNDKHLIFLLKLFISGVENTWFLLTNGFFDDISSTWKKLCIIRNIINDKKSFTGLKITLNSHIFYIHFFFCSMSLVVKYFCHPLFYNQTVFVFFQVASLGVTTFTLCALCIDRFRAATNVQMYYEMIENCTSTAAKLAVIWIGALLLALPELLIRQLVSENGDGTVDEPASERCLIRISTSLPDTLYVLGLTYEGARLWWCFGCYFCLPTLFTIGSSVATARRIRRAERGCARGNKKQIRLESQMNCTVVALAIVYGACVVPENVCNMVSAYMAAGVPQSTMALLHLLSQLLLFLRAAVTPVLLLCLCRPLGHAFLECCCCADVCGIATHSSATASDDNEHECTTELELSPFSTIRREMSNYTATGSHC